MKRCCSLEPFCYCERIEPEDRDELHAAVYRTPRGYRYVSVRRSTPDEEADLRAAMIAYAAHVKRTRRLRAIGMAFVVAIATIVMLLAGCDPRDGYVEPSPSLPTPTIMYTVILPQGGIYDNN